MYDEFGNYIGPELESDESEKEEEEEADEEVSVWCASNRVSANNAAGFPACCREEVKMGKVRREWRWLRRGMKERKWRSFFMKTRSTTPLRRRCMDQMWR